MKGNIKTSKGGDFELVPAGTYEMVLDRVELSIGYPSEQYRKYEGEKFVNFKLVFKFPDQDEDDKTAVFDSFLKTRDGYEFDGQQNYKSKFQKRLEQLLGRQLGDEDGPRLEVGDQCDDWAELLDMLETPEDNGKMPSVRAAFLNFDDVDLIGQTFLVTVGEKQNAAKDKTFNTVLGCAPKPVARTAKPRTGLTK